MGIAIHQAALQYPASSLSGAPDDTFVGLGAGIQLFNDVLFYGSKEGLMRAVRHLRTQQNSDLVERLPFPVECEQRANLKVTCGDVEGLGYATPFF